MARHGMDGMVYAGANLTWTAQLNTALSQFPNSYNNRVFGALSFREADTATATFDYTIHVSKPTQPQATFDYVHDTREKS